MANTTSGTTAFDKTFAIDEIIEEAFRKNFDNNQKYLNVLSKEFKHPSCFNQAPNFT